MKFIRLISGVAAVTLTMSALSFSTFADINKRPLEIGFETGLERQDSDDFDFLDKPYSVTSGDYYIGIGIQTGAWTHRNAIGVPDGTGETALNKNNVKIAGINKYCSWAHLYSGGYALIKTDESGVALQGNGIVAYGPAGLYYGEDEEERGIKEYAQLHDVKITGSGTYTAGIQGYNFKADVATNYGTNDGDPGNGINLLYLSSNIPYLKNNDITISNPVLKLYNTREEYEAKTPYKTVPAEYWITGTGDNYTGYVQYTFTNKWAVNGYPDLENGGVFSFDKKYQDNEGSLDVFGVSSYTGKSSTRYMSGYEGCQFLPEYALEITFDVNMPSKNIIAKPTSTLSIKNTTQVTKPIVKPKKVKIKKVTSPKVKNLKVTWKKVSGVKGYEIKLATNKKFTKGKKIVKVNKGSAKSAIIKNLKSGTKYYVKVRAYTKVDGKKKYGKWSNVKSGKTKVKKVVKRKTTTTNTNTTDYGLTYVLNPDSMKVHIKGCRTFKYESKYSTTNNLLWALENGYTLCGVCWR